MGNCNMTRSFPLTFLVFFKQLIAAFYLLLFICLCVFWLALFAHIALTTTSGDVSEIPGKVINQPDAPPISANTLKPGENPNLNTLAGIILSLISNQILQ